MAMASSRNPVGNRIGAWIYNKRESVHIIAVKRVFSGRQKLLAKSVGMSELEPNYDQNQALGALIQIVGSSISIIGLNAQKWAMDEQAKMDEAERARCCSSWRWTLAFLVFTGGQIVQTAAYAYGSQSLVSAMSNLSLVTNAFIATLFFGEPFTMRPIHSGLRVFEGWDLGAVLVLIIGTLLAGLYAPVPPETKFDLQTLTDLFLQVHFLLWLGATVLLLIFSLMWWIAYIEPLLSASEADKQPQNASAVRSGGLVFSFASAAVGSISVTLSKIVVLLVRESLEGKNQFTSAGAYIFLVAFIACAILSLMVLNAGLARFEAVIVIPVYYVLSTIMIIISGELLYNSYENFTPSTAVIFTVGILLSLWGVYLLSCHEGTSIDEPEGRGRTASLPVRYLRPGRRALSVAGPTAPRPALAGRLAAKASRRRNHFGGGVQARTRFARTSSIDFMVSQWNSGAPTEGAEGAGADGANATGAGSGSAYGSTASTETAISEHDSLLQSGGSVQGTA